MATIRLARKEDVKALVDFFSRMYRLNSEFDPLLSTPDDLEDRVAKCVEKSLEDPNVMIVVAEEEGKIVGAARVLIIDREFYSPAKEALIREFYVHPAYRRQGVGSEIVNFIESELRKRGIEILGAMFPSRNLIAVSFYKKMGFRDIYSEFVKKIK